MAVLSGLLLAPAYFQWGTGFIMFIALVPLLWVEEDCSGTRSKGPSVKFFWYPVLVFMIFNLLTVWWVKNSVFIGIIAALVVNTTYMTAPFLLFHYVKRHAGPRLGYLSLIVLWISFEYLFLNVQVTFPWILLGNAFANDIQFVQWYEITGTLGGTLWVLVVNVLIFRLLLVMLRHSNFNRWKGRLSLVFGVILIPVIISLVRFYTYEEEYKPYDFAVLQPNIDPWQKFVVLPQSEQTDRLLNLADSVVSANTDYIVAPETFINNSVWHHTINVHPEINRLKQFVKRYPDAKFIIGAMTFKRYDPDDSLSPTAKKIGSGEFYYDSFNSALQIDNSGKIQMYHKSLLVTGAEWMPAFNRFELMRKLAVDLGGITRSHGTQEERSVFVSPQDGLKVAPVICWESVFGEYVTDYIKDKGAEFIIIITNDGWWKDTPGHRQHNSYAHLRAIETRRSIARSANTGISSLINQRGEEITRTGWWERTAISGMLNANDHLTFYVRYGDYIGRISAFLSVLLVLYAFVRKNALNKAFNKSKKSGKNRKK